MSNKKTMYVVKSESGYGKDVGFADQYKTITKITKNLPDAFMFKTEWDAKDAINIQNHDIPGYFEVIPVTVTIELNKE